MFTKKHAGPVLCDLCETVSPPSIKIMEGHGLTQMGWYCSGGVHLCPACPHPTKETKR